MNHIMKKTALILAFVIAASCAVSCRKPEKGTNTGGEDTHITTQVSDEKDTDKNVNSENTAPPSHSQNTEDGKDTADTSDKNTDKTPHEDQKDTQAEETKPQETDTNAEDTTAKAEDTKKPPQQNYEYTDGIVIEAYLHILAGHFYENYKEGDSLKSKDLLHLTALFILTQQPDNYTSDGPDSETFSISEKTLEDTMQTLFGEKATLSQQDKYLDSSKGDEKNGDTYTFLRGREDWGSSDNYLSYDHKMEIDEKKKTFTAKVTVIDGEGKEKSVTYYFDKMIENGYLNVKLTKVKVG